MTDFDKSLNAINTKRVRLQIEIENLKNLIQNYEDELALLKNCRRTCYLCGKFEKYDRGERILICR